MCLTIRLTPVSEANRLLQDFSTTDPARRGWRFEGRSRLGRHDARLSLHACELLADDADWDAPTWAMAPGAAEHLADTLSTLLDDLGDTAIVEALWEGEAPSDERPLSRTQFVALVGRGELGTHTRYRVDPYDAPAPQADERRDG